MIKKNFWARYGKSRERVHVLEFWPAGSDLQFEAYYVVEFELGGERRRVAADFIKEPEL